MSNETADPNCTSWTVVKLKDECRRLGLPVGGNKPDLCQRLNDYYAKHQKFFPRNADHTLDIVPASPGRKVVSKVALPSLPSTVSPAQSPTRLGRPTSPPRTVLPPAPVQDRRRQNPFASLKDIKGLVGDVLNGKYYIDTEGVYDQIKLELPEWTIDDFKNVFETIGLTRPKPPQKNNYITRLLEHLSTFTSVPGTVLVPVGETAPSQAPQTPTNWINVVPPGETTLNPKDWTVVKLKAELQRLGKPVSGTKPVLMARLEEAYRQL